MENPNLLQKALEYHELGFTPIPLCTPISGHGCVQHGPNCSHPGKIPLIRWAHLTSIRESHVERWWRLWPNANIGALMGNGIVGLDIDPRHDGWESLNNIHIDWPQTAISLTGGGGEHWLFTTNGNEVPTKILGPGLELHSTRTSLVLPPSLHSSGKRYVWQTGRSPWECVIAPLPESLLNDGLSPISGDGAVAVARRPSTISGRSAANWVEDALRVNGIDPSSLAEDPGAEHTVLLRLWHSGVPEGGRWLTLRALLREARRDGATADDLAEIAQSFADRCNPPFPDSEVKALLIWISRHIKPWNPDMEVERSGPSASAWSAGYWLESDLGMSKVSTPNGEPTIKPSYFPKTADSESESRSPKITAVEVLKRWQQNLKDDPMYDWNLTTSEELLVEHTLDEIKRCGGPGVRDCGEHRTLAPHRPCRNSFHDSCETALQTKTRVVSAWWSSPTSCEFQEAADMLSGPLTLLRLATSLPWPWTAEDLDRALAQIKGVIKRRKAQMPQGALCGLRLEPYRSALAAYLLAPGKIEISKNARGRPSLINVEVIGEAGNSTYDYWWQHVGGAWVGYLPDDDFSERSVLTLLQWSRNFAFHQGQGKSRVWGIGYLGSLLAKVRLVRPYPVCQAPTRDIGWFDEKVMALEICIDSEGREYEAVVDRGPPDLCPNKVT